LGKATGKDITILTANSSVCYNGVSENRLGIPPSQTEGEFSLEGTPDCKSLGLSLWGRACTPF